MTRTRIVSFGGALAAALAASSCCLGPLLLAALGVGGAGVTTALGRYRPHLLVVTAPRSSLVKAAWVYGWRPS